MADSHKPPGSSPGPAVDRTGQPVIDPSRNVLDLVEQRDRRQDDLREMQARYVSQIGQMREGHAQYIAELRAQYGTELRIGETARIDAIRAVDVGAAAILANQVAASAEALRGQVEAARQQTATALAAALEPIQKDIQDLRRAQYEAQGKQGQVVESRDVRAESRLNVNVVIAAVAALIGFLILAVALYAALHK
jgi:hypothetical protein